MTKKERYKKNWQDFVEIILPSLEEKYKIKHHQNAVKIFTKTQVFNYYPKGERLNIEVKTDKGVEFRWLNFTLEEFEEHFVCLTPP